MDEMNGYLKQASKIERFCLPVTLRCNLNCKLCAERSPYYEKPYHPTLLSLQEQLDAFFALGVRVGMLDITGGEPFLRGDLGEIITYIHARYRGRVDTLRVTTNGTKMPPEGFMKAAVLWRRDIYVIVDQYPVFTKCKEVADALQSEGVPFELRDYSTELHCDGWVDYGDLTLKRSKGEARKLYKKCLVPKLGFFSCMVNGRIFPCARARLLYENALANVSMNCFDPQLTLAGKQARLAALHGDEVIHACRYCNGLCEDSERFPAAEQLDGSKKAGARREQVEQFSALHNAMKGKTYFFMMTYNNEKTIRRAIESVLAQTCKDFSFLIINNGSTDRTGEIILEYAAKDPRIMPLQVAKNDVQCHSLFLEWAWGHAHHNRGTYRAHVDGDDAYHPRFLETALQIAEKHNCDFVVCGFRRVEADTGKILNVRKTDVDMVLSSAEAADNFPLIRNILIGTWSKLYNDRKRFRKYLVGSRFRSKYPNWIEQYDTLALVEAIRTATTVGFVADVMYDYYQNPGSTIYRLSPTRVKSDSIVYNAYMEFLAEYDKLTDYNINYLYAIYLSFISDTLDLIYADEQLSLGEKLGNIAEIFANPVTKEMLAYGADPQFKNLAARDTFLQGVLDWVYSQKNWEQWRERVDEIAGNMGKRYSLTLA